MSAFFALWNHTKHPYVITLSIREVLHNCFIHLKSSELLKKYIRNPRKIALYTIGRSCRKTEMTTILHKIALRP